MTVAPPLQILLEFDNISYIPPGQTKQILYNVSGSFKPSRVTAILGPSGAGKSTLLNIITHKRTEGRTGAILVNGRAADRQLFRKQCSYIEQRFVTLGLLTVRETLRIAAAFKLDRRFAGLDRKNEIEKRVLEVMRMLGMTEKQDTRVELLSGGELKRVSICVELINNPPVMIFDEPTSGLDSSAALNVMKRLKALSEQGITVVVVIHQPSSRCFEYCDDVFMLAAGHCLYNGPRDTLTDTFARLGFHCPSYFNIAEYAVEVASEERPIEELQKIVDKTKNVRVESRQLSAVKVISQDSCGGGEEDSSENSPMLEGGSQAMQGYPISSLAQFRILLWRCTICINRDINLSGVRLFTHTIVSVILGVLFYNFGNDAAKMMSNFSFIFFNILFVFFATSMPTICTFPSEADVFLREQSNNWYSLRVYYFAKILADVPLQLICPTIFVGIGWYLTGQPLEWQRVAMLWLVSVLVAVLAQTMGNAAGAALPIETAVFMVPSSTIPVLLLSGFFVTLKDLYPPFRLLSEISYFRFAFEAACQSIFGYNRPKMDCSEAFCRYKPAPQEFLEDIGMNDFTFGYNIICLVLWIVAMQILLYAVLRYKLAKAKA